ncbi:MAG TPA: autotransporter-associated beta strand repeat-containing protein, partial [Verrucomicrobiae bacterium]|nr:autotransporter-associated beta strand repeat-containing protein [Verrucomicrobiae bacterium]
MVLRIVKLLIVFACTVCSTVAFGQATLIWSGGGDGTNLDTAANWGGTLPSTANNDEGQFNGVVPGNLLLNYSIGNFQSGPGQAGINFHMTPSQTGSVQFTTSFNDSHTSGGAGSLLLAITHVTIDAGAGAFSLGPTDPTKLLAIIGRPNGAVHLYRNDSANVATINTRVLWKGGGGANWTLDFLGNGDWQVNNNLMNDNGPGMSIQVDGPGTMFWNPALGYQNANGLVSPVVINGGKMVLQSPHPRLSNQAFTLTGIFDFDAPGQAQTLSGVISGTGVVQVNNGTLTLSGASFYTGNTLLSGGELFVNRAENPDAATGPLGFGGLISFTGGTLGYTVNNTFDYSSRFDTSPGQAYKIDTAGQNVAFTNVTGLTSSGGTLTKLGPGTLTLAGANSYGNTFISAGKLLFQGTKSGTGDITVSNSTILGVTENGSQITPATLTVGTTSGATLEFNNVNSTSLAPLAAGTISAGGPITVNVASGSFVVGQSYPLFSWTSGSAPAVTLGTLTGAVGNLSTNGTKIQLNVTGLAYIWSGITDGNWDTTTANNWKVNGVSQIWSDGNAALFDDLATGATNVVLNSPVAPASTTVNSTILPYTITSSGANVIGGSGGLVKNGNSVLTLSGGVNSYTGPT